MGGIDRLTNERGYAVAASVDSGGVTRLDDARAFKVL